MRWRAKTIPEELYQGAGEGGEILLRARAREEGAQRVDPVIKINHSVGLHSTGTLAGATGSNTVGSAHLGALWERARTCIFIRRTQIKTSTA